MHGKMQTLIRKVYSKVTADVRTQEGLTEHFDWKLGVRQDCMLIPRLFIIFINELEKMLKNINIEASQWVMRLKYSFVCMRMI